MTKEKQIEVLLELDGWEISSDYSQFKSPKHENWQGRGYTGIWDCVPKYLDSRDAIIPLIAKYINKTAFNYKIFLTFLQKSAKVDMNGRNLMVTFLLAPPAKLAEALIRALGKWEE